MIGSGGISGLQLFPELQPQSFLSLQSDESAVTEFARVIPIAPFTNRFGGHREIRLRIFRVISWSGDLVGLLRMYVHAPPCSGCVETWLRALQAMSRPGGHLGHLEILCVCCCKSVRACICACVCLCVGVVSQLDRERCRRFGVHDHIG